MLFRVRLDSVTGSNALLTSNGWGKAGLYVKDGILTLEPPGANMWCEQDKLDPKRWYYLGMTRDEAGKITLYVDGYPCSSDEVPFLDHFALSPMSIEVLRDEVCPILFCVCAYTCDSLKIYLCLLRFVVFFSASERLHCCA